jgi:hypothetical protein
LAAFVSPWAPIKIVVETNQKSPAVRMWRVQVFSLGKLTQLDDFLGIV